MSGEIPERGEPSSVTRSTLSGSANDVVQANTISGGVHFHGPAPQGPGPVPRQLPADVRFFVNRHADLERLDRVVGDRPVNDLGSILITGTAGVGKTSLAVRWAHRIKDHFPDGQLYINLRGYDPGAPVEAAQALEQFLIALHTPAAEIPADLEARSALFRSLAADRRILIVLDNAARSEQVRPLLPGSGGSLTLVTSRTRISGLIARDGAHCVTLDLFPEQESVALLRSTTEPYRGGDDEEDFRRLARLCANLPLALRIAAERAASHPRMPLASLIAQLGNDAIWEALSYDDDPEEADAIRAVFAWSYRALTADVSRLFRLLGLHVGPDFSAGAAAALAGVSVGHSRKALGALVRAHLVEQTSEDRYQFHDLLRAYAIDQVRHDETTESRDEALQRELDWYIRSAVNAAATAQNIIAVPTGELPWEQCEPQTFATQRDAVAWYDRERPNIVAIAREAVRVGHDALAWQLAAAVYPTASVLRASFDDSLAVGELGLQAARRVGARHAEAVILGNLGVTCNMSHRDEDSERYHRLGLQVSRELGDKDQETRNTNALGWVYLAGRRLEEADAQFAAVGRLASGLGPGERKWTAVGLINQAAVHDEMERWDHAADLAERALALHADAGIEPRLRFDALRWLAHIRTNLGDFAEADRLVTQADAVAREIGSQIYDGIVAFERGWLSLARGEYEASLAHFHLGAGIARNVDDQSLEGRSLDGAGEAFRGLGRADEAADFHRSAAMLFRRVRDPWQQAVASAHLAADLDASGDVDTAARQRREALGMIAGFVDSAATALRARLESMLEGSPGG